MHRKLILLGLSLSIGCGGLYWYYKSMEPAVTTYRSQSKEDLTAPLLGGDFVLIDHNGKKFDTATLRGKLVLVYFGYRFCPDICPMALNSLSQTLKTLGNIKDKVQVLFVTLDPERDTVDELHIHHQNFDPNIIMLTGSKTEIDKVSKLYKASASKTKNPGNTEYQIDHSSLIYVIGADGKFKEVFSHETPAVQMQKVILRQLKTQNLESQTKSQTKG